MTYPLRLPQAGETWRIRLRANAEIPPCPHCGCPLLGIASREGPSVDGMEVTVSPSTTLGCIRCHGRLPLEGWYDTGIPSSIRGVTWAVPYTFLEPVDRGEP